MVSKFTQEVLIIGFITIVIGVILKKIIKLIKLDKDTKERYHFDEISLFLLGAIVHILLEYSGLNKLYCKNGVACQV